MTDNNKIKLVAKILQKKHPDIGISVGLSPEFIVSCESIPTGSMSVDIASCLGGLPRGRIVEIFGPESSGKTTLALHIIAEAQKLGYGAAFIDVEHALDPTYARTLGVEMENLILVQPDTGEQALEVVDLFTKTGDVGIIVVDSVSALVPKAELDAPMDKESIGLQARLMSKSLRKLTGVVAKTDTLLIFINQTRSKIGVMFGNPETTSGGNALKFYASMRLRISGLKPDYKNERRPTKVKFYKNKLGIPFREAEFDIVWGKGIDRDGELVSIATDCGIIDLAGSWYSYKGEQIGQGRINVINFLNEHLEMKEEITQKVYEATVIVTK